MLIGREEARQATSSAFSRRYLYQWPMAASDAGEYFHVADTVALA